MTREKILNLLEKCRPPGSSELKKSWEKKLRYVFRWSLIIHLIWWKINKLRYWDFISTDRGLSHDLCCNSLENCLITYLIKEFCYYKYLLTYRCKCFVRTLFRGTIWYKLRCFVLCRHGWDVSCVLQDSELK